jgi:hypothetical protein
VIQSRSTLNVLIFVIFSLISNSCCNKSSENFGIIQDDLNIDGFYIVTYDCMNLPDTACVRNNEEYHTLFKITSTNSDCGKITLPFVDFTKNSLLIYHKDNGGKIFYQRTVTVDSTKKIVTYLITTASCPVIMDYRTETYNIVFVPKIGLDYKIEYK